MGNEDPIASMDASGKVILARHNEISLLDLGKLGEAERPADGERLSIASKELDVCEIYPQSLMHNSNGRFAVVTGDGEYVIYTALAWRKKSFGTRSTLCGRSTRASTRCVSAPPAAAPSPPFSPLADAPSFPPSAQVRENPTSIKLFRNFK